MRFYLCLLSALFLWASLAVAEEVPFKQYNPDVDKYEFAKSFISGLEYYGRVADRLVEDEPLTMEASSDAKAVRALIDHRTLDNTEIRIAKNYLAKYQESANGLIRKIAIDVTGVYDRLIEMSVRERDLWQSLADSQASGAAADWDTEGFAQKQIVLAQEKKEVAKNLIRQTTMIATALLSAERCADENCRELALSQKERDKLSSKLDGAAKGNLDWGMKAGQSTVQACVAILREVLEDPVFTSRP